MKKFFSLYFSYSKRETQGIIVLLFLILILKSIPYFFPEKIEVNWSDLELVMDSIEISDKKFKKKDKTQQIEKKYFNFPFNPNSLSKDSLKLLNLSNYQINTILFYRKNNWQFLSEKYFYEKLKIDINQQKNLNPIFSFNKKMERKSFVEKERKLIELNTADSTELIGLKGIGPKYASRIIRYRNRLGGFYSIEQLREVFGMEESVFIDLKKNTIVDKKLIRTFNLTLEGLDAKVVHPYFQKGEKWKIINYIKQRGGRISKIELSDIIGLDSTTIRKINPYIND